MLLHIPILFCLRYLSQMLLVDFISKEIYGMFLAKLTLNPVCSAAYMIGRNASLGSLHLSTLIILIYYLS